MIMPQTRAIKLKLPLPPSLDELYRDGKFLHIETTLKYKKFKKAARLAIIKQTSYTTNKRVAITIAFLCKTDKSDIDNREKALLDALQSSGIIKNDNQIWAKMTIKQVAAHYDDTACIVWLRPIGTNELENIKNTLL